MSGARAEEPRLPPLAPALQSGTVWKSGIGSGFRKGGRSAGIAAGVSYFLRERLALNFRVRWLHLSNADIEQPNTGSNSLLFLGGLSWFFD